MTTVVASDRSSSTGSVRIFMQDTGSAKVGEAPSVFLDGAERGVGSAGNGIGGTPDYRIRCRRTASSCPRTSSWAFAGLVCRDLGEELVDLIE